MSDRSRWSRPDGELPPDPWAGLADPPPPAPPPPPVQEWDDPAWSPSHPAGRRRDPAASWHPSTGPRRHRSPLQHPALWVALTGLALLLLVTAVLERGASAPPEPSPGSIDALSS